MMNFERGVLAIAGDHGHVVTDVRFSFAGVEAPPVPRGPIEAQFETLVMGRLRHVPRKCGCCWLDYLGDACIGASGCVGGHPRKVYRRHQRHLRAKDRRDKLRAIQLSRRTPQRGGPAFGSTGVR
jgi:hypothetical protein